MKPFFWSIVSPQDLGSSVFKDVDDLNAKVDKQELEKLFSNAPAKKAEPAGGVVSGPAAGGMLAVPGSQGAIGAGPAGSAGGARGSVFQKKVEVELIDPKRSVRECDDK